MGHGSRLRARTGSVRAQLFLTEACMSCIGLAVSLASQATTQHNPRSRLAEMGLGGLVGLLFDLVPFGPCSDQVLEAGRSGGWLPGTRWLATKSCTLWCGTLRARPIFT